jgi:hypothetical protein
MAKSKEKKKEDLTKLTVRDLREIVVKLGIPEEEAENFGTKKPLIATINALRAKAVVETPGQRKKDEKKYLSKKERMRAILMEQKKVRILIPLEGEEKPGIIKWKYDKVSKRKEQVYVSGAYTPVQINGFKWLVPHGKYEEVPEQIADMIADAQGMTAEAGRAYLIDRIDPKTGKPISDKLE